MIFLKILLKVNVIDICTLSYNSKSLQEVQMQVYIKVPKNCFVQDQLTDKTCLN